MSSVSADPDALDGLAGMMAQMVDGALSVIECLAVSGNHGGKQGLAVNEAVAEFNGVLTPAAGESLNAVRRDSTAASQVAALVRETETVMTASIAPKLTNAEVQLAANQRGLTGG